MRFRHATGGLPRDHRDVEIERLRAQLAEARTREVRVRAEERERFSQLSAASRRFAHSMRSRMDEKQRQQRRLDAQYAVSRVLEEAGDLVEAGPGIFRALGAGLGWDAGVLWIIESGALRCAGIWRPGEVPGGFEEACGESRLRLGDGLPGRVWRREEACWVEDVLEDEGYPIREAAAEADLRCALGFPIQDGGRLAGVFELLKKDTSPVDEDLLRVTYLAGHQIGQFVERRRAEEERDLALSREREARQRIGGILESINDAFFALDHELRFTYLNDRAEAFFGKPRRELLGRDASGVLPEGEGSGSYEGIAEALRTGEPAGFEVLTPVTGAWISARVYPNSDGVSVFFEDISERKRSEEKLRESEERFRLMADAVPQIVWLTDPDGRVEFYNRQFTAYTGVPYEPATAAEVVADHVHPDDVAATLEAFGEVLRTGGTLLVEHRIRSKEGDYRWFLVRAEPYHDPRTGEIIRWFGASVDIHDRKVAEAALRSNEERWRALVDKGSDVITISDGDGTVRFATPSIETVCGHTVEEFVGSNPFELGRIHPDDLERCKEAMRGLADNPGRSVAIEHRYLHKTKGWRWLEGTFTGLFHDPAIGGLVANFRDVTERKEAEEALRESEEKYRTLFGSIDEGFIVVELAFDAKGRPADYRVLETNEAFERQTGLVDAAGKTALRLAPNLELSWIGTYGEVALTGEPVRFESYAKSLDRWWSVYASRVGGDGSSTVSVVFDDITERKRREAHAAFLAEVQDAFALPSSADEIMQAVGAKVGAYLNVTTCNFLDVDEGRGELTVSHSWEKTDVSGLIRTFRTEDFLTEEFGRASRAGETTVVRDTQTDPRTDARAYAELDLGAFVGVPFHRDGEWRFFLSVTDSRPRDWREDEVELFRELSNRVFPRLERARAEEALKENDDWLRLAQRYAGSGTWEWELRTGEIRWSGEHRELFGFDPSDEPVDREDWWAAVHPEDLPRIEEAGRRCLEEDEEWPEIDYRIFRNGEIRWIAARGQTERDEEGRAVRILGISVDATGRKEAEEERDRLLARQWVATAETAERERISRELHDRVAHSMGVAHQSLQLHDVLAQKNADRARAKLDLAKEMTKASLESTRNLSAELRRLDAEDGLEAELRYLLDVAVPPGIRAGIRVEGNEADVPGHVRGQLFLVLREAVRNAVAHSGCHSLSVGLDIGPKKVVGSVQDDGRGFDTTDGNGGVGLRSMRERTALLDGGFELDCRPGMGTRVEVSIPLAWGQ
ncbi:PAS domain S-box protein [Rubrobacter tropicus]|uniref:histidine kinase n=1 Tax=Rubrobacter tropicus TaxID=2653851 RepID=A0A6G8QBT7_9ACTN|nr:PAS domain S-box protein [Rubrobacter tropicus]QIN83939.1 PAS domain S-box protein [Rubrobacter tropicus]